MADIGSGQPPTPPDTVRQLFGEGVRAGLYPLSSKLWYWFICWNCPPVSLCPSRAVMLQLHILLSCATCVNCSDELAPPASACALSTGHLQAAQPRDSCPLQMSDMIQHLLCQKESAHQAASVCQHASFAGEILQLCDMLRQRMSGRRMHASRSRSAARARSARSMP